MADDEPTTPGADAQRASDDDPSGVAVPPELPLLPLRGVVLFPSAIVPLAISRPASLRLVRECWAGSRLLGLAAQRRPDDETPGPDDLYPVGTAGRILKTLEGYGDGTIRILVQGLARIAVESWVTHEPYLRARVHPLADTGADAPEVELLRGRLIDLFGRFVGMIPNLPEELKTVVANIQDPGRVADLVAANLNVGLDEKQELLAATDVRQRLERLVALLERELALLELGHKIHSQVQDELAKNQKEFYLRQQLKAIQRELGEGDARTAELNELRARIEAANLPEAARTAAEHELERLAMIPPESAEHGVVRNYLEWLATLPWSVSTEDNLDLHHARRILDEDHFDLEKIKDRILEHLAVRKLKTDTKGPILCFVGPPGVGKTSLGRSIARAMGRRFVRMSLGGVRDEAEIRGHRRTYVGALPGRIVQNLKTAGSNNPLFVLDEIDKLGMDFRGDPASALLEVLDPEQNATFVDHYLDVPFDLQQVMFVTTANVLDPVPAPLRDRMEVIELAGYTEEEKLEIARRHIVPKQLAEHGLTATQLRFEDDAVVQIIRAYTREAGLRNLERQIGRVCRKVARAVTEGRHDPVACTPAALRDLLGPERFFSEAADRIDRPGVAVGLAWTPAGGDILFVEATRMPGTPGLLLTGQLGDVMKESAQAAMSWVRANAAALGIPGDAFEHAAVHLHVPAGGIPKDGPSAGVTMAAVLASLFTGRLARGHVAMTGEITLHGRVLPVGGIKEKVLAARRAGIRTVVLPHRNASDLDDVPAQVREELRFVLVSTMEEVLAEALAGEAPPDTGRA